MNKYKYKLIIKNNIENMKPKDLFEGNFFII